MPENNTARRTGASLAGLTPVGGVSPHTVSDSIHGSAIVTPTPRRKVRRENWCILMVNYGWTVVDLADPGKSLVTRHLLSADFAKLFAADDRLQGGSETVIAFAKLRLYLGEQWLVR